MIAIDACPLFTDRLHLKTAALLFFSLSASFLLIAMLNMVVCVKDGVKNNSK